MPTARDRELLKFARAALHGLDQSASFVGILDGSDRITPAVVAFTLQLGRAILTNKPIVITLPHGVPVPPKLERIADRIVRYNPDDPETLARGVAHALRELGIITH